jgi:hypothetical protein
MPELRSPRIRTLSQSGRGWLRSNRVRAIVRDAKARIQASPDLGLRPQATPRDTPSEFMTRWRRSVALFYPASQRRDSFMTPPLALATWDLGLTPQATPDHTSSRLRSALISPESQLRASFGTWIVASRTRRAGLAQPLHSVLHSPSSVLRSYGRRERN